MIFGARKGSFFGLRRIVARAMAYDLNVFVIPGPEIALTFGLDLEAAGLQLVESPRHASVLLFIGDIPSGLLDAATVIYAQMMRPRILFALHSEIKTALDSKSNSINLSALPAMDVIVGISQEELISGVEQLRTIFSNSSFIPKVSEFHADILQVQIEYTCSMHPEIVETEPGSCPKCGMDLIQREVQLSSEQVTESVKTSSVINEDLIHKKISETNKFYTCPMHPEVSENVQGKCPKCGMNLELLKTDSHMQSNNTIDHYGMEPGFMSMIDITKDLPRSGDGLAMDWIDVPFGPFFPGLPSGLVLILTLDGDTVADSSVESLVGFRQLLSDSPVMISNFIDRLSQLDPLTPRCYQILACSAIENAVGFEPNKNDAHARVVALECERILTHLSWLVLFGQQTGFSWLTQHATKMKLAFHHSTSQSLAMLKVAVTLLVKRLSKTPLLKSRTANIGKLTPNNDTSLLGPVARSLGINNDARNNNKIYQEFGFTAACGTNGDAWTRLMLRIDEIIHSIELIEKVVETVGSFSELAMSDTSINTIEYVNSSSSGTGEAVIETARGLARLKIRLQEGQIVSAQLTTPSTHHLTLVHQLTKQQELGDALVAVASLDLSPWEIQL